MALHVPVQLVSFCLCGKQLNARGKWQYQFSLSIEGAIYTPDRSNLQPALLYLIIHFLA